METAKPTYQHGFGFEKGENLFSLPGGQEFDTRKPDAKHGIKGSSKEAWEAFHKLYPNLIRKQGEDYSKMKLVQLQRLVAKRLVKLKKGETVKDAKVEQLVSWLKEWEQFKR